MIAITLNKKTKQSFKQPAEWWANLWRYLSIQAWGSLSAPVQRSVSALYGSMYNQAWSRFLIKPYCWWHYSNPNYMDAFQPSGGKASYACFQDFFIREFKQLPMTKDEVVWPCEGTLCHAGPVEGIPSSNVKGDKREVADIFGLPLSSLLNGYYFSNVFLHNKNYHRIHSPINGVVRRIQHIPGELIILRPWIYPFNPSVPAFRNERINVDLEDEQGRIWYLSIVGGPAVGSISLAEELQVGSAVQRLEEIAVFNLGSTCCLASPERGRTSPDFQEVWLGNVF